MSSMIVYWVLVRFHRCCCVEVSHDRVFTLMSPECRLDMSRHLGISEYCMSRRVLRNVMVLHCRNDHPLAIISKHSLIIGRAIDWCNYSVERNKRAFGILQRTHPNSLRGGISGTKVDNRPWQIRRQNLDKIPIGNISTHGTQPLRTIRHPTRHPLRNMLWNMGPFA